MRNLLILLCLVASPAAAQDAPFVEPKVDSSLVDACLDNVSTAAEDGAPFPAVQCIGVAAEACMDRPDGSNTGVMITCVDQEAAHWDGLLNIAYKDLVAQAERLDAARPDLQPTQVDHLREAQRSWIAFRDASCKMEAGLYRDGSMMGPMHANCLLQLTGEQALRLQTLLLPDP